MNTPSITLRSDKDPLSYRLGEEMRFAIAAIGGQTLRWTCTGDDGREEHGCTPVVETAGLPRPGFVHVAAELLDADGKAVARCDGGAGAAVADIRQDFPEPSGFDAFWTRRKAALAAVPWGAEAGSPATCRELQCGREDVRLYEISVPCAGGRPSTGHLSIPSAPGRYPAQVHFHGYNNSWSEHAYKRLNPETLYCDRIFLDLSAHGFELNREPEYYEALRASCGSNGHDYAFDPIQNSDPDTAYFGGMAWRVLRGLEYLKSRPEWDGKNLTVEGGSQGALQSIWGAALDHDVTECRIYIPWCCNIAGPASGRAKGDWHVPWVPALGYYDTVNMARRIPATCRVTVEWAGLGDYICPPSGVMAFYNNLTCPRSIKFVQGATHFHNPPAPTQTSSLSASPR